MLTNWFSQPAGARSSTDDGRSGDVEDDTQVMEADQGNGEQHNPACLDNGETRQDADDPFSPLTHHFTTTTGGRPESSRLAHLHS